MVCKHYNLCGGCSLQHLSYEEQLSLKQKKIEEFLKHFNGSKINNIIPSKETVYFRNKMEFAFGKDKSGKITIGLRQSGKFWSVVDINECLLMSETSNRILSIVREWANSSSLAPYDLKKHKGFLRYLMIREAKNTNQVLLYFVTTPTEDEEAIRKIEELAGVIRKNFEEVKTFIWAVSGRVADVAVGEEKKIFFGDGYIYETLCNFKFRLSPTTFFQTNPKTAEVLYSYLASLCGEETTVLDLYCGCGTIGIFINRSAEKIIGVDSHKPSIDDAIANAEMNSVRNCEFVCARVEDFTKKIILSKFHVKLSTIILDPPRAGLHKKLITALVKLNPNRVIYVSCNLKAFINDFVTLSKFYRIRSVQPIDLFPHTEHVELVVDLEQR
jgi:23S rRNA (uracil1939-C5)-methyltransferase